MGCLTRWWITLAREWKRQGYKGYVNDFRLIGRQWDFELRNIRANPILWYHGEMDSNTSCDAARRTVSRVKSEITFKPFPQHDHNTLMQAEFFNMMDWLKKP
jgi:hypothetical protein